MIERIYEIGIIFRGFTLVSHNFRELPLQKDSDGQRDLRAAFISAINSFAETAFNNNSLEYLESGNILFIFKMDEIKSLDKNKKEPIILYGLADKKRRLQDKFVKRFLEKVVPIIENFKIKYNNKELSHVAIVRPFEEQIKEYFIS